MTLGVTEMKQSSCMKRAVSNVPVDLLLSLYAFAVTLINAGPTNTIASNSLPMFVTIDSQLTGQSMHVAEKPFRP